MKSFFRRFADGSRDILAVSRMLLLICIAAATGTHLNAQANPTASSDGDLQIGAMFNLASSDYYPQKFKGYGFYTTFDFRYHLGIEGEFHQVNDPATTASFERTYEIGPRYVWRYQRFNPYAKVLYGRGVFNYPLLANNLGVITHTGTLAYNIGAAAAGLDYRLLPGLNARVDYEYQRWFGFPPHGLTPQILSIGVAYRFH